MGVGTDSSGNIYVADSGNNTVRKVTPAGAVTTLAGLARTAGSSDGTGTAARFNFPTGIAVDSSGDIFVADSGNDTIRNISPALAVTTIAGAAGQAENTDGLARTRASIRRGTSPSTAPASSTWRTRATTPCAGLSWEA